MLHMLLFYRNVHLGLRVYLRRPIVAGLFLQVTRSS